MRRAFERVDEALVETFSVIDDLAYGPILEAKVLRETARPCERKSVSLTHDAACFPKAGIIDEAFRHPMIRSLLVASPYSIIKCALTAVSPLRAFSIALRLPILKTLVDDSII